MTWRKLSHVSAPPAEGGAEPSKAAEIIQRKLNQALEENGITLPPQLQQYSQIATTQVDGPADEPLGATSASSSSSLLQAEATHPPHTVTADRRIMDAIIYERLKATQKISIKKQPCVMKGENEIFLKPILTTEESHPCPSLEPPLPPSPGSPTASSVSIPTFPPPSLSSILSHFSARLCPSLGPVVARVKRLVPPRSPTPRPPHSGAHALQS
ncbi:hypothetical protein E2C01_002591 [Portunus trituberculatus]|uniref:Uncharacterized protein n=1 Tax=Portunus trituberculatus TaxID=210409 RepID=A0A5B7CKB7_PORTR|nr:hypothetical protein [Portunus trituberculatus]